jgi:hypothetical protein
LTASRHWEKWEVHGSRILFLRNSNFDVTKEVIEHLEYQTGELHTVSELVDVRLCEGSVEVKARWRGHEAWEATWESMKAMREDVPVLLQNYLDATRSSGTAKQKSILVQHHL